MNARPVSSLIVALAAIGLVTSARADVTVRLDLGNAPRAHIVFRSEPHVVYVPEHRVYVVDDPAIGDDDCFHYGPYWYAFSGGYWYRARSWRGPFIVVHPRYVPTAVYRVPPGHWRHRAIWVPPGQAKKMARDDDRGYRRGDGRGDDHGDDRGRGKGKGKGKGKGRDKDDDKPHLYGRP